MFPSSDKITDQSDEQSAKLYDAANAIIAECKQTPSFDLNSVISALEFVRDMRFQFNLRQLDSLNNLSAELVTRYIQAGNIKDLDTALKLRLEAETFEPDTSPVRLYIYSTIF